MSDNNKGKWMVSGGTTIRPVDGLFPEILSVAECTFDQNGKESVLDILEHIVHIHNINEELVEVLEEAHILICNCMEKNISPLKEHPDPAAIYTRCESVLTRAKEARNEHT